MATNIAWITGAQGFLGTHVVRALEDAGSVRLLRAGRDARAGLEPAVQEGVDYFSSGAVPPVSDSGQHTLIHLEWRGVPSSPSNLHAEDSVANVLRSVQMLEMAARRGVRKVIFASSGGAVYGDRDRIECAENMVVQPTSAYAAGKLAVEAYFQAYAFRHGLCAVNLRISNAYGPGQQAGRSQGIIAAAIHAALSGNPLAIRGDGSAIRDFVFAEDVAAAFVAALDYQGPSITLNVGTGKGRSVRDVLDAVECATRCSVPVAWKPAEPSDLRYNVLDVGRARDVLGWTSQVGFSDGLQRTVSASMIAGHTPLGTASCAVRSSRR